MSNRRYGIKELIEGDDSTLETSASARQFLARRFLDFYARSAILKAEKALGTRLKLGLESTAVKRPRRFSFSLVGFYLIF